MIKAWLVQCGGVALDSGSPLIGDRRLRAKLFIQSSMRSWDPLSLLAFDAGRSLCTRVLRL